MKESEFQAIVAKELRLNGAQVLNKVGNFLEGRGWPDLFVWHKIWTGGLELKIGCGRLSTAQSQRIALLRDTGFDVRVLRLVEVDKNSDVWDEKAHPGNTFDYLGGGYHTAQLPRGAARLMWLRETVV